jgi:GNAT superfamily N-acetyltransferase
MLSARSAPLAAEPEVVGSAYLIAAAVDPQRGFRSRRIILWLAESASADGLTARAGAARMPSVVGAWGQRQEGAVDDYSWIRDLGAVDMDELSSLYRIAPLGDKPPEALAAVFGNSMFMCFVCAGDVLVGAGRVLADGLDCAYIADVAVHPGHQGRGLGKAIIGQLVALSHNHKKIILYANPGTGGFYGKLGFLRMNTAMAIWHDPAPAIESGLLSAKP